MKNINASTINYHHLTAMKVLEYCLAGWNCSLVVLHWQCKLHLLLQILAKNWEWHLSSCLTSYLKMLLLRPLLSSHDFQRFIHVLVALTVFCLLLFQWAFVFPHWKFPAILLPIFLKTKAKNYVVVFSVVLVTLLCHPFLLLYHNCTEIMILSTNQINDISWLILLGM